MSIASLMAGLNPPQKQAVEYIKTPLLVLAGAGSGKTRVITSKIAWLIKEFSISSEHITALTFTNKAAKEMQQRIRPLLSAQDAKDLTISTFHSLGLKILRAQLTEAGLRKGFSIIDQHDSQVVIADLMAKELNTDPKIIQQVQSQISSWKNEGFSEVQVVQLAQCDPVSVAAGAVYPHYNKYLTACNTVDLDDLIRLPRLIFEKNPQVLSAWQDRIRYLLVDEYQDTNGAQYELIRMLCGERGRLTVVGDDDQSIYGWRGAQPENLAQLQVDFPDLKVIKLEQNYRSCGRVISLANALIANNPRKFDKSLWTALGYGDPVRVLGAYDESQEAERVISALLHHQFTKRSQFGQYAILYRSNHQARVLEKKLREMRISYTISGGQSFFDRTEIRDIMAYLRLVVNPNDDNAFLRIVNRPRRGVGAVSLEKLAQVAANTEQSLFHAAQHPALELKLGQTANSLRGFAARINEISDSAQTNKVDDVIKELLDYIDYETWLNENSDSPQQAQRRMNNVTDLINWLKNWKSKNGEPRSLADVIADMMLINMLDKTDDEQDDNKISLMTLHTSKGLEYDYVFIVGLEEGILPHRQSIDDARLEEERRLFYVGITRARKSLVLSYAQSRKRHGEKVDCELSRFISELPEDDLDLSGAEKANQPVDADYAKAQFAGLRASLG